MWSRPTLWGLVIVAGFGLGVLARMAGCGSVVATAALIVLGVVQLTEDQRAKGASRVREALRRADIGIRKAALHMEVDASDLERMLKGEMKLDLWRLEMLPNEFWQEFWPLLARDKGVPDIFHTWLKSLPVILGAEERSA